MESKLIFDALRKKEEITNEQIKYTEKLVDSLSYNNLGYMYFNGIHPSGKNINKAVEMYEKGAELGNIYAVFNLAYMYRNGDHPDGQNINKAVKYYEKLYELDDIDGLCNLADGANFLGELYRTGKHPNGQNFKKAVEFFEKSLEMIHYDSGHELAYMYHIGEHPDGKNINKAIELYEYILKNDNHAESAYNLANIYENGLHRDGKNIMKAIEFYKKSFDYGYNKAILRIMHLDYYSDNYANMYDIVLKKGDSALLLQLKKPSVKLSKLYVQIEDDCSICFETLMNTRKEIVILTCGHMYHNSCCAEYKYCVYCNQPR